MPTSSRRTCPMLFPVCRNDMPFPSCRDTERSVRFAAADGSANVIGPMWASAPTNVRIKVHQEFLRDAPSVGFPCVGHAYMRAETICRFRRAVGDDARIVPPYLSDAFPGDAHIVKYMFRQKKRPSFRKGAAFFMPFSYLTRTVQPYGSAVLPHWIPVRVSYSFWDTSPILPSLIVYFLPL